MNENLGGQMPRSQWDIPSMEFAPYQSQLDTASQVQVPMASPRRYSGHLWASFPGSSTFLTEAADPAEWTNSARQPLLSPNESNSLIDSLGGQMTTFAIEHDALVQDLRKRFQMPLDSSVTKFLSDHGSVVQLLLESTEHLKDCFGSSTIFTLRAELDESGSRTLYVTATWSGKVQEARDALDKFDKDWWLSRAGQAGGYLTFTYELV